MAAKKNPFASEAALEALVQYGPKNAALKALQQQAVDTYGASVTAAQAAAQGTQGAIHSAQPELERIYNSAASAQAAQRGLLTPGSATVAAALAREGAQAKGALVQEAVSAQGGAALAQSQARAMLAKSLGQIGQQQLELAGEKGAFTASTIDKLTQAALERASAQKIAAGHDSTSTANNKRTTTTSAQNTADRIAADKQKQKDKAIADAQKGKKGLLSGGVKPVTALQQQTFQSDVTNARGSVADFVREAVKRGQTRGAINRLIAQGIPGYTVHDPQTGKVKIDPSTGAPEKQPGLDPISDELVRNVILDQILYNGGITAITARKLHRVGYKVNALGKIIPIADIKKAAARRKVEQTPVHLTSPLG